MSTHQTDTSKRTPTPTSTVAMRDPSTRFRTPSEVLVSQTLTDLEKRRILEEWFQDALQEAESAGEGMEADRTLLLREVSLALEDLDRV